VDASIILSLNGTPTSVAASDCGLVSGSCFDWAFTATLSSDQKIDSATGISSFAVIYDFLGVAAATATVLPDGGGVTLTAFLESTTIPQPVHQSVPDNPAIPNVRVNIEGSLVVATELKIFRLDAFSTTGSVVTVNNQSAQAVKEAPGLPSNDTEVGNTNTVSGPGPFEPIVVPEGSTTASLSLGLITLGLIRCWRYKALCK
jgi:hypothetical protein